MDSNLILNVMLFVFLALVAATAWIAVIILQYKSKKGELLKNANEEADKLFENAQNSANQLLNQVRHNAAAEANQALNNAKKEAQQTLDKAKEESEKEAQQILNEVTQQKNAILQNIEKLNTQKQKLEYCISSLKEQYKEQKDYLVNEIENERKIKEVEISYLKDEYKDVCAQIELASKELLIAETTIYVDDNTTSEEIKSQLAVLNIEYGELVRSDNAIAILSEFGYESKRRFNDNKKQILRCFNSESKIIINSVTATNADKMRGKLTKSFQTINAVFSTDCLAIDKRLLELRLKELDLVYFYHRKKEQEQEEQKAIREQMLEEEKIRREIEREKAKVEKEETQFKNEINKLMKYLVKATEIEKQLYVDKIKELEDKVKLLEKDKENILEREQNTRAGYVYVISNIGSFGENIYKIGMTRRLEPMDRVKELGDASVPFEFDVHAMIFSEDAPALETILHNTFKDNQVNLVNPRKEFYNVSLADIEKVVKENYNATVTFTQIAKATQYRESQKIKNNLKNNEVFV